LKLLKTIDLNDTLHCTLYCIVLISYCIYYVLLMLILLASCDYAGKTFTMQGPMNPPEMKGVIPNSFTHIFDSVKAKKLENPNNEYLIHCSFLEIYNEVIR
jgi:hypothetical protein